MIPSSRGAHADVADGAGVDVAHVDVVDADAPDGADVAHADVADVADVAAADAHGADVPGAVVGARRSSRPDAERLGPDAAAHCRRLVHLRADPRAILPVEAVRSEPAREVRRAAAAAHRAEVLRRLRESLPVTLGWAPTVGDHPAVLWRPRLETDTRWGTPDLLLWDGDGYRPVIVVAHRTLDPGCGAQLAPLTDPLARRPDPERRVRNRPRDLLALAHHHRLLQQVGLACASAWGGVVGLGGPSDRDDWDDADQVVWFDLGARQASGESEMDVYDLLFADRLAVARSAATGGRSRSRASRVAECRRCPWWTRCEAELIAADDVSLVISGGDVAPAQASGLWTVAQLADLDDAGADRLTLSSASGRDARAKARAMRAGLPLVRRGTRVAVPRADVEMDVDMESYLDDGAYLWGTLLTGTDCGIPCGYRGFATWHALPDRDAGRVLAEFWDYLERVRSACAARGLTFRAYCYSRAAEERWLRGTPVRYPDVPGMPTPQQVSAFCDSAQWIDLYAVLKEQFLVTGSLRLKAVAPLAGFAWRDPAPGGENSMAWYRAAIGADGMPPDEAMARRVLQYNEDDVRATLAVRRWLSESADALPTVSEL